MGPLAGEGKAQADRLEIQKKGGAAAHAHAPEYRTRIRTIAPPRQASKRPNHPAHAGFFFALDSGAQCAGMPFTHRLFGPARGAARRGRKSAPEHNPALQDIWHVIASVPRGQVATYGEVARAAGLPGRARMTAYALRMAPDELALPWHRILGAGGRIVFAPGSKHFREQARRLRSEGIAVTRGKVPATAIADLG
jgi:methylated-DNA-protein-cysteine methyltransferase-like protein